jgi:hypothetical protein
MCDEAVPTATDIQINQNKESSNNNKEQKRSENLSINNIWLYDIFWVLLQYLWGTSEVSGGT